MSLFDYEVSREISKHDFPFASLIMAAMRKADTTNSNILRDAFPHIYSELVERYRAPGGRLCAERDVDTDEHIREAQDG